MNPNQIIGIVLLLAGFLIIMGLVGADNSDGIDGNLPFEIVLPVMLFNLIILSAGGVLAVGVFNND